MSDVKERLAAIDPQNRDTGFMLSVAVRYCLDRHSYAPSLCCDWLRSHWRLLSDHTRALIARDIREHIASEHRRAETRAERPNLAPPGWECDLRTWEQMAEWIAEADAALIAQAEQGASHGL